MGDMSDLDDWYYGEEEDWEYERAEERAADGVWRCGDGSEVLIQDMTDSHLINAKRMMDRKGWETPYHTVLLAEIRRRGLPYP